MPDHRIGVDVVAVDRVRRSLGSFGAAFRKRLLTVNEAAYCQGPREAERVAGRIAAKEAVMKILGDGWPAVSWTSIEILSGRAGRPEVKLSGRSSEILSELGLSDIDVSITHDGGLAIAVAVAAASSPRGESSCSWLQPLR